jgi:hypothetical protein
MEDERGGLVDACAEMSNSHKSLVGNLKVKIVLTCTYRRKKNMKIELTEKGLGGVFMQLVQGKVRGL